MPRVKSFTITSLAVALLFPGAPLNGCASTVGQAVATPGSPATKGMQLGDGASDRVLLIGVGRYRLSRIDLPGIDTDVALMRETALRLGFPEENIVELRDEEATRAGVEATVRRHLGAAGEKGRVLLYFSGHGMGVRDTSGDEDDDQDEALVLYDYDGRGGGLLIDDDLASMLNGVEAQQVLLFVDACHSGSVYKSLGNAFGAGIEGMVKGIGSGSSRGFVPVAVQGPGEGGGDGDDIGRLVAYTAAKDDQQAIATKRGSVFTLGVHGAIRDAAAARAGRIGYEDLQKRISSWIKSRNVDFEPSLYKATDAPPDGISVPALTSGAHGPGWNNLLRLAGKGKKLVMKASKPVYALGDLLEMEIEIPEDGYLNVVSVDQTDKTVTLFPNAFHPDNRVAAGTFHLPSDMGFRLKARPPAGQTLVVAFWTRHRVNLHETSLGPRNEKGGLIAPLGNETVVPKGWVAEAEPMAQPPSPPAGSSEPPAQVNARAEALELTIR